MCRCGRTANLPSGISDIEQIREVNLLGVHFNNHLSFYVHFNSFVSAANRRFYLMKLFSAQGLNHFGYPLFSVHWF